MKMEKKIQNLLDITKAVLRGTSQPCKSTSGNKKSLKQPKFTLKGTRKRTNRSPNQQMEKNKDQSTRKINIETKQKISMKLVYSLKK